MAPTSRRSSSTRWWTRASQLSCAIAFSLSASACGRTGAPAAEADAGARAAPGAAAAPAVSVASVAPDAALDGWRPAPGGAFGSGDSESDRPPSPFVVGHVVSGRSVGHTSVVFKLHLEGDADAAYKPRSTIGDSRYKGEIAAHRLGRALGLMVHVPVALARSFPYDELKKAVGTEKVFAEVKAEPDGQVRGALIPWIRDLEFATIDKPAEMTAWRGWLKADGVVPDDQRSLASQISTMLAFDMLTGNWDRWSGANVGINRKSGDLLFVDNDGAFFDPVPAKEMKRGATLFDGVDKFSRRFVAALRALDVAKALGEERPGEPLLSERATAACDARRRSVLGAIDAKIAKRGEGAVLAFE